MNNIILFITLLVFSNNLFAKNNFFEENFNKNRMELSDTYRYLISKENIEEFIKENSSKKGKSDIPVKYLNKNFSDLCLGIYIGEGYLIKNTREGEICLKYATLSGFSNAAFLLSELYYNQEQYKDSITWLGLSAGLGYNVRNNEVFHNIKNFKDFEKYYKNGLIESLNFPLHNYNNNIEIINNFYISNTITEPRTFNPDNQYFYIYKYLKDFDYLSFVEYQSNNTNDAAELISLSYIKNKDWISFIKYCNEYIKDIKFKQYCLKQIYKNTGESKSLLRYAMNESKYFKEEKINNEYHFNNFFFALGLGKEQKNKYLIFLMNDFFNNINDIDSFEKATSSFNDGRKYFYNTRNSK